MTGRNSARLDDILDETLDDTREPTQVTKLLADYDACIDKSRETMVDADKIAAKARSLAKRRKDIPSKVIQAVRDSTAPPVKSDGR